MQNAAWKTTWRRCDLPRHGHGRASRGLWEGKGAGRGVRARGKRAGECAGTAGAHVINACGERSIDRPTQLPKKQVASRSACKGRARVEWVTGRAGREAVKGGAPISEHRRNERPRSARSAPASPIGLSALRMRRAKSAARTSSSAGPTCAHTTSSVRTDDGSERGEVGPEHGGSAGPVRAAGVACGGRARPERGFKMHGLLIRRQPLDSQSYLFPYAAHPCGS